MPYGSAGFNQYTNVIPTYQNHGDTPWLRLSNPYPNGLTQPAGNTLGLLNDVGYGANGPLLTAGANQTPYEQSWSLGLERELPGNMVINAEYIGKKGTHLPFSGTSYVYDHLGSWIESLPDDGCRSQTIHAPPILTIPCLNSSVPNPFFGVITDPNSGLATSDTRFVRSVAAALPQFTGVSTDSLLIANSIYHALQLSAEKRYSNGLQFLATFTWSKSIDDSSQRRRQRDLAGKFHQPAGSEQAVAGTQPVDVRHSTCRSVQLQLRSAVRARPDVPGKYATLGEGDPRRMEDERHLAHRRRKASDVWLADGLALPTYGSQRPNMVGKPKRNHGSDWVFNYFVDPSVFQQPAPFTLGNAPRAYGGVRSPWTFTSRPVSWEAVPLARGDELRVPH